MNLWRLFLILVVSLSLSSVAILSADHSDIYFIDAHSQVDSNEVLQKVIRLMDQAGIQRTILAARGKLKPWDIANFAEQHPDRITASIRTKGRPYEENNQQYYRELKEQVDSRRFKAMSELLMYHAQKGRLANEVVVYPNDRRIKTALNYALENGWPFVVHIEFASLSGKEKRKFMEMLEEMLNGHQNHSFAMIHMGQLSAPEVRRLIESHKNVYFLTSHSNPLAVSKSDQPWVNMFKGEVLAPEWKELVIQYPDRFILAFDNVWSDHWGDFYLKEAQYWRMALSDLPINVGHAIAHGNAERLWRIPSK